MQKIIGVTELQRSFRHVFDEVANEQTPYVLTRGSNPEVALIPYADYLEFMVYQEAQASAKFEEMAAEIARLNAAFSDVEISADIDAAIRDVRQQVE